MAAAKMRSWVPAMWLVIFLLAASLLIAPPLIRGLAADAWVTHYASLPSLPRPRKAAARHIALKADLAVANLAPLPQASAAALRALEIGQRLELQEHDPEAALVIYQGVRAACARVRERPLAGPGFAVIEARAATLLASVEARKKK
jgi:uncharacterized SAM-binding protein YcdF (DUF218 family)